MALYNIYAGLGGGFGGANYQYSMEFESKEEANLAAYEEAIEIYQSCEGVNGLRSQEDVAEDYCEENDTVPDDLTEEDNNNIYEEYQEEVISWIDYYAILASEDSNLEEYELEVR